MGILSGSYSRVALQSPLVVIPEVNDFFADFHVVLPL